MKTKIIEKLAEKLVGCVDYYNPLVRFNGQSFDIGNLTFTVTGVVKVYENGVDYGFSADFDEIIYGLTLGIDDDVPFTDEEINKLVEIIEKG